MRSYYFLCEQLYLATCRRFMASINGCRPFGVRYADPVTPTFIVIPIFPRLLTYCLGATLAAVFTSGGLAAFCCFHLWLSRSFCYLVAVGNCHVFFNGMAALYGLCHGCLFIGAFWWVLFPRRYVAAWQFPPMRHGHDSPFGNLLCWSCSFCLSVYFVVDAHDLHILWQSLLVDHNLAKKIPWPFYWL